jgi:hypothetical protein
VSTDTPARAAASPIAQLAPFDSGAAPGLTLLAGGLFMTVLVSLAIILLQDPARAMGFDQAKVAHHFRVVADGGSIEVEANDPADTTTVAQIRAHLREIAKSFGEGDFSKPVMTHGEQPPGVTVMQQRKADIHYVYEERPRGGIVRITTADGEALRAVHDFLEYQIREHHAK